MENLVTTLVCVLLLPSALASVFMWYLIYHTIELFVLYILAIPSSLVP